MKTFFQGSLNEIICRRGNEKNFLSQTPIFIFPILVFPPPSLGMDCNVVWQSLGSQNNESQNSELELL